MAVGVYIPPAINTWQGVHGHKNLPQNIVYTKHCVSILLALINTTMADFSLNMSSQEVAVTKNDPWCKRMKKMLKL